MHRALTIVLQGVIVLIGIGAGIFLLVEPHFEGRNVGATLIEIYFNDPFLAYAYVASIAFFVGVVQVFKVVGYFREPLLPRERVVGALRTIEQCAFVLVGFIVPAVLYLMIVRPEEDIAGGVALGLFLTIASLITGSGAGVIARKVLATKVSETNHRTI